MNGTAPVVSRWLPLWGILLILEVVFWFAWHAPGEASALDLTFVVGVLLVGVLSAMRRNAEQSPGKCGVLLLFGIALALFTDVLRFSALLSPPYLSLVSALSFLSSLLESACVTTSGYLLLGSAVALLEDPARTWPRRLSRAGAILGVAGFSVYFLTEVLWVLLYRSSYTDQIRLTVPAVFDELARILLLASMVLALRRADLDSVRLRRQGWILRLMLAGLAASGVSWIATASTSPPQIFGPWWRTIWLSSINVTLLALNSLLAMLAFRKAAPGYNSAPGFNSSTGAGA